MVLYRKARVFLRVIGLVSVIAIASGLVATSAVAGNVLCLKGTADIDEKYGAEITARVDEIEAKKRLEQKRGLEHTKKRVNAAKALLPLFRDYAKKAVELEDLLAFRDRRSLRKRLSRCWRLCCAEGSSREVARKDVVKEKIALRMEEIIALAERLEAESFSPIHFIKHGHETTWDGNDGPCEPEEDPVRWSFTWLKEVAAWLNLLGETEDVDKFLRLAKHERPHEVTLRRDDEYGVPYGWQGQQIPSKLAIKAL